MLTAQRQNGIMPDCWPHRNCLYSAQPITNQNVPHSEWATGSQQGTSQQRDWKQPAKNWEQLTGNREQPVRIEKQPTSNWKLSTTNTSSGQPTT
jgi:hypothetical protein